MTARTSFKFAAALLAGLGVPTVAAHAGTVRFCNETDTTIQISVGYREDGSPFTTRGWWGAAPGKCTGHIGRGSKGTYYVFIAKAGGEPIAIRSTGKMVQLCIAPSKFEDRFREHVKDNKLDCASDGLATQKFVKLDTQPEGEDAFALQADGTLKPSGVTAQPPVPPRSERIAAPHPERRIAAPVPQATPGQTPEACRRYPNLC